MREIVFRERQEKVAFFEGITHVVARLFNFEPKIFSGVVRDYAEVVFQEMYDVDLLKVKKDALQKARERIRKKRAEDVRQISKLERLGQLYDEKFGPLKKPEAKPRPAPEPVSPRKRK